MMDKIQAELEKNNTTEGKLSAMIGLAERANDELASLREERDDYKSKWEYVEGLNKAVVAQNDSIKAERDALKLVADAARTGQGLDDALDALDALKGEK
jgi:hypothetical protein